MTVTATDLATVCYGHTWFYDGITIDLGRCDIRV